jgi:PTH1 family peptidyl-tRNA hydrolase
MPIKKKIVILQTDSKHMKWIKKLLDSCKSAPCEQDNMKYLIAGLGNVGAEYQNTRHNIGFMVADAIAKQADVQWTLQRRAYRTEYRLRGRTVVIIKPTTYMNLSGEAVRYWLQAERVPLSNLLVVVDDIALPLGTLRMKKQGSGGGHNGLRNIETLLGTTDYCRLRIGVGNNFGRGQQIEYVLGTLTPDEETVLLPRIDTACKAVETFVTLGPDRAMNLYNQ